MSFRKVQNLSKKKRKIILWTIVIIIGGVLLFFWFKGFQEKIQGFETEKLNLPNLEKLYEQ